MEDEINIDFKAFFRIIWKEKILIFLITFIFTALGVLYAYMLREEYSTHGKILPELQGRAAGGLSQFAGLASLAGVDLNSMSGGSTVDAVRPDLYPDVITSTPFFLELFKSDVYTRENKKMTFQQYFHEVIEEGEEPEAKMVTKYPVKEDGIIVLNRLSEIRLKNLKSRITAGIDKKSGVITISCKMPDPVVAACVAKFAMRYLMSYVTQYRTEKLRQDVDYLAVQVAQSRGKFYSSQEKKARYSDQFQEMALQSADVNRERIESDYRLSSSFYNELLKKYEEAKFKLHKETPVFQVLEPPVTPVKRSEPKRAIIAAVSLLLGGMLSIGFVVFRGDNYRRIFGN